MNYANIQHKLQYTNINNSTMTLTKLIQDNVIQKEHLTLFAMNIRSISKNFEELQIVFNEMKVKPDVIILSECWIKEEISPKQANTLTNYNIFYTKKNKNKSDGVVVYLNENISQHKINELQTLTMTWIKNRFRRGKYENLCYLPLPKYESRSLY